MYVLSSKYTRTMSNTDRHTYKYVIISQVARNGERSQSEF